MPLWPGTGLSLAWLGALGGALVALDAGLAPRLALGRALAAVAVVRRASRCVAVPALTAIGARRRASLTNGPASTLPAYVAAEGRDDPDVGTIVLTPQNAGGVAAAGRLGRRARPSAGRRPSSRRAPAPTPQDAELAELAADLVTHSSAEDVVAQLADCGIGFVLLAPAAPPESDAARTMRLSAHDGARPARRRSTRSATPRRATLWRVDAEVAAAPRSRGIRSPVSRACIAIGQLAVLAIALLLALPTAASRRAARRTPRVVGPHWREGR